MTDLDLILELLDPTTTEAEARRLTRPGPLADPYPRPEARDGREVRDVQILVRRER